MGEARRRHDAGARIGERLLAVPPAGRDVVATAVRRVAFVTDGPGGRCAARAVLARQVVGDLLGLAVPVVIGGMIYRAGPHPIRDSVCFCGPDNRLARMPGGILGHYWLEAGGVVLDFSPPEWGPVLRDPSLRAAEVAAFGRDPGDATVAVPPPAYVWARRGEGVLLPTAPGEPPLGHAYYTPEPALPEAVRPGLERLARAIAEEPRDAIVHRGELDDPGLLYALQSGRVRPEQLGGRGEVVDVDLAGGAPRIGPLVERIAVAVSPGLRSPGALVLLLAGGRLLLDVPPERYGARETALARSLGRVLERDPAVVAAALDELYRHETGEGATRVPAELARRATVARGWLAGSATRAA